MSSVFAIADYTTKKCCLVVGDIYRSFSATTGAITESAIIEQLSHNAKFPSVELIILGQGLSRESTRKIISLAQAKGLKCVSGVDDLNSLKLTHKVDQANILISLPSKLSASTYKYDLLLDDSLDRLSDHVTGSHIGAMLLMEAARQGVICALELEFPSEEEISWSYVLERFNSEYLGYAFPVPTEIIVKFDKKDQLSKRQIAVSLSMSISQSATIIAEMKMDVQLYEKRILNKIEGKRSREVYSEIVDTSIINNDAFTEMSL